MSDNKSTIDLTPLQQEKIDQAAKDYADSGSFQEWLKLEPFGHESSFSKTKRNFKAGASYYRENVMPGMMVEFAEWIRTFEALERQNGQWVIESQISDKDIVKAFFEDLKQKQSETSQ